MKKIIRYITLSIVSAAMSMSVTSCLDEVYPEDSSLTKNQIAGADKSSLVGAIPAYFTTFNNYYSSDDIYDAGDVGFGGFLIQYDTMTADYPIYDVQFDYFSSYEYTEGLYDTTTQTRLWRRYYYFIRNCNLVLGITGYDPSSADAEFIGTALAGRAWAYMDLVRLFEYKHTNVAELDRIAQECGLYGATVPKVTENTTEAESRNAIRTPFYDMYRFMMNDINIAEACLHNVHSVSAKCYLSLGTVYGLKARLWLEMATRFELYADDLALQVQAEDSPALAAYARLDITTARECYENAAKYARMAINEGFSPLSETQWYDPKNGFNSPNQSWMYCIIISSDNGLCKNVDFQSWAGLTSPEATYGVCTASYGAYHMIDARLNGKIDAILTQKRIEFWGEGIVLFDYRRRELPIERGYPGTNHFSSSRFNSYPNAVAPWTNICMPERVKQLNPSFQLNPDPSLAIPVWKEQE